MALSATQKLRVRSALHRAYSANRLLTPWTKPDADAVITDTDGWLDSTAANYNSALSQPYRGTATAADKSVLLITVAIAQRLVTEPEYIGVLRQILAEVADIQGA